MNKEQYLLSLVINHTNPNMKLVILPSLCLWALTIQAQQIDLPEQEPLVLEPIFSLYHHAGLESSGLVKSRTQEDLYWFHNDSGNEPRIFPFTADGTLFTSNRFKRQDGVLLLDAQNIDWEDMAITNSGDLIVADFGNNYNDRKDLLFYVLAEPSPYADFVTVRKKMFFRYPDQQAFPDSSDFNYDSEAVFHADDHIYLLTKHRSDTFTKLYRLDEEEIGEVNALTYLDKFDIGGKVTGADVSEDGNTLVVITYDAIWVFVRANEQEAYFEGEVYWLPYEATQVESVCLNGNNIRLLDEATSEVFEVSMDQLVLVKKKE